MKYYLVLENSDNVIRLESEDLPSARKEVEAHQTFYTGWAEIYAVENNAEVSDHVDLKLNHELVSSRQIIRNVDKWYFTEWN